jgi:hypothetical protein
MQYYGVSISTTHLWPSSLPLNTIPRAGEAELVMGDGGTLDKMCILKPFLAQRTLERSCAGYSTWGSTAGTSTGIGTSISGTTSRCTGTLSRHTITVGSFTRCHCCWTNMTTTWWSATTIGSCKPKVVKRLIFISQASQFQHKNGLWIIFLHSAL